MHGHPPTFQGAVVAELEIDEMRNPFSLGSLLGKLYTDQRA